MTELEKPECVMHTVDVQHETFGNV